GRNQIGKVGDIVSESTGDLISVRLGDFVGIRRPVWEEHLMTTMFVRHTVSDYKTWRKVYDDFAPVQKAKGVAAEAVYRAVENPNDITVTHEFATIEAAQAFAESAELKNAMQKAGVAKAPTIWFTKKA
ncbi:hypothetical protein ABIB80_007987, partial [Bradyrhizobium sp. i1.15.2]